MKLIRTAKKRLSQVRTEAALRVALPRRLNPISRNFGIERGQPIDRHYIESFLDKNRLSIGGHVLETGGFICYGKKFGDDRVRKLDILYPRSGFPDGTLVGDLNTGEGLPSDTFDCLIMTQTFGSIFDVPAAAGHCYRVLRPGGTLLATVSGISQTAAWAQSADWLENNWGDYWRFTSLAVARLFEEHFGRGNVQVETYGNVLSACAVLMGLSSRDLSARELNHHDPQYQVIVAFSAAKAPA